MNNTEVSIPLEIYEDGEQPPLLFTYPGATVSDTDKDFELTINASMRSDLMITLRKHGQRYNYRVNVADVIRVIAGMHDIDVSPLFKETL